MQLTSENYYSQEANKEYMSVSGYKDFAGTYGKMPCEFYGMEKLNGRWEDEKSTALLVGSYVDSYFEGSLEQFKKENPEIFTQKGELKANFKQAEEIIARIERDEYFMKFMSGQKQVIMTGELFGAKWKIKMDSYIPDVAMYEKGKTYIENYEKYGCTTWYDWCTKYWGTKWNAYSNEQRDEDTIEFETAWSNPEPIMLKLSEMYPEATIEHWWADEDMGSNDGYRVYRGGKIVEGDYCDMCSNEAYETYVECWGESECLYKDDEGLWQRRSCEECHGCD